MEFLAVDNALLFASTKKHRQRKPPSYVTPYTAACCVTAYTVASEGMTLVPCYGTAMWIAPPSNWEDGKLRNAESNKPIRQQRPRKAVERTANSIIVKNQDLPCMTLIL